MGGVEGGFWLPITISSAYGSLCSWVIRLSPTRTSPIQQATLMSFVWGVLSGLAANCGVHQKVMGSSSFLHPDRYGVGRRRGSQGADRTQGLKLRQQQIQQRESHAPARSPLGCRG